MKTHTPSPPSESAVVEARSLTYQQAAVRLGVSAITLRRWRGEGRFKVRVFSSTLVRIPIEEIERMEKEALV
jgi:predicted site-specific integrase-resolvase